MNANGIRMLRLDEVMAMTGLSRSSLYAMIKRAEFPKQVQIGPRAVRWDSRAVDGWLAEKLGEPCEAA